MFQKLRHSDTCNQVKSCTKHGRPDQSQRELNVALIMNYHQKGFFNTLRWIPDASDVFWEICSDSYDRCKVWCMSIFQLLVIVPNGFYFKD